jgi:hypothetical protein
MVCGPDYSGTIEWVKRNAIQWWIWWVWQLPVEKVPQKEVVAIIMPRLLFSVPGRKREMESILKRQSKIKCIIVERQMAEM